MNVGGPAGFAESSFKISGPPDVYMKYLLHSGRKAEENRYER